MSEEVNPRRASRKKRQPEPEVDPEFQIAPMIDILLVLLVFFMSISSTEVLQANRNVSLPVAKDAKDAKPNEGQVIINIAHNNINNATIIEVDQREYPSPADLVTMLDAKFKVNPMMRVVVRADRQVRYEYLRTLLEVVGRVGIGNITFSVVDKEEQAAPAA